jgi:hypothetical protein
MVEKLIGENMKIEYINPKVDRSKWADPNLANGEPDKVQWIDANTGLDCLAVRHPHGGFWCGYVGVPASHPMYGKDYDVPDVEVHYGLTFSDKCMKNMLPCEGVCHIPQNGRSDDIWWFGFDCAHLGDLAPGYSRHSMDNADQYRPLTLVEQECKNLAKQLAAN